MPDGRRTRWVAHDVYFLDAGLGEAMFDRFGGDGIALWHGFIAACKKNHVEGETTFANDVEALATFGVPGLAMRDNDGKAFTLADWLKLLSDHKVIRRTSRGRRVKVVCTKWARWQQSASRSREAGRKAHTRAQPAQETRRSAPQKTRTDSGQYPDEASPDLDLDTDKDRDTDRPPNPPGRPPRKHARPPDFTPSDTHRSYAAEHNLDLDAEFAMFCDNADAKGHTYVDWSKALSTFLRQAVGFGRGRRNGKTKPTATDVANAWDAMAERMDP